MARDSAIIGPLCSHGLRIVMCSLIHNQCWISRPLWNPWNNGINNVAEYNKRKLIGRIVLAGISGRLHRNSHICYYVCDRRHKYNICHGFPLGEAYFGEPASIFLGRSQSVGQTNFIKATLPGELISLCFSLWRPARSSSGCLWTSVILSKQEKSEHKKTGKRSARRWNFRG